MLFTRRHITAQLISNIILIGIFAYGVGILSGYFTSDFYIQLATSLIFFLISTITLLLFKLHIPLKIISDEMKALLTGKSYRKIITSKRNEIGVLAHFFNEITKNLENIGSDVKEHKRIRKELNIAQKIQRDLIPEKAPQVPGLDIIAKTRPASEIGGDTFNFFENDNRTLMYIGDSTGHGIPAGIVMIMVDTLITTFIGMFKSTVEIMVNLNKYLKPHLQTTMFMTMILLEWDQKSTMKWIGAGHEFVMHVHTSKGGISTIPSGGIAIGMIPDNSALVKEQTLIMEENDFLVLFSDGITEAKNVMGELYSVEKLEKIIKSTVTASTTSEQLFNKIAIDVGRFMEGHFQEDDMTLMIIKKTSSNTIPADKSTEWTSEENSAK